MYIVELLISRLEGKHAVFGCWYGHSIGGLITSITLCDVDSACTKAVLNLLGLALPVFIAICQIFTLSVDLG